jgi:hypothetical protein
MKRTDFLKNLGIGIVTVPLIPSILSKEDEVIKIPENPVEPPKPIDRDKFFTLSSDSFHITDWDWVEKPKFKPKSKRKRLSGKKKHGKRKRR